jgi:hypothetical protein
MRQVMSMHVVGEREDRTPLVSVIVPALNPPDDRTMRAALAPSRRVTLRGDRRALG